MKAGASGRWWLAWVDPLTPGTMLGPIPFGVRMFTPAPSRGSLSITGTAKMLGFAHGFTTDRLPTIATMFALWREGSSVGRVSRKRFTSSRATIHRREIQGENVLLTIDFPDYVAADEDEKYAVGEWLRAQVDAAAAAAFAAITPIARKEPAQPAKAPKMSKGGARALLDAMSAEPEKKPEDERSPQVIPPGAKQIRDIPHNTPPPDPAPAGALWIDGHNIRVSVGGGWWIQHGSFTISTGASMGKS